MRTHTAGANDLHLGYLLHMLGRERVSGGVSLREGSPECDHLVRKSRPAIRSVTWTEKLILENYGSLKKLQEKK